jgi:protein gp37
MSAISPIEWTDATWNPTTGCTKVSPGCAHCYIERTPGFRINGRKFVNGATDLQLHENRLEQPLHWRKPRRVFVNSLSDLFHADIPDAFIDRVFAVMAASPQHSFQVLTKRPRRMQAYMCRLAKSIRPLEEAARTVGRTFRYDDVGLLLWPIPNVWVGVSVENQRFADERIPLLLQTPAAVRFISAEPLLERLQLAWEGYGPYEYGYLRDGIDWVIVGGESGPGARPFDIAWARAIVAQCQATGVACFVKQLGAHVTWNGIQGGYGDGPSNIWPIGNGQLVDTRTGRFRKYLNDQKGGDPAEWPEDLRVREFPTSRIQREHTHDRRTEIDIR